MRYSALVLLIVSLSTYGHGGGTDSSGCHNNSKTGDYHCHKSKSAGSSTTRDANYYSNDYTKARSTPSTSSSSYSRDKFGKGWKDTDGDCQDSRHEALIAQSTAPVRYKSGRKCKVTAGRWISPFTGAVIHDPSAIDIDHVVPLQWAWNHGAQNWTAAKRERFANDQANLLSVEASLNRQKGAKGLDQWLPPSNQCQYVARFLRIVKSYGLALSNSEQAAYSRIKAQRCN